MPASLPAEIFELMTQVVSWESFQGFDGHAEPSYAPGVDVKCWQEAHGAMSSSGGVDAMRRADGTVVEPKWNLLFSGDDPLARQFQLYDRFTSSGTAQGPEQSLQAVRIDTIYGPPFDDRFPWLIIVTL